jgi:hypothetical protein
VSIDHDHPSIIARTVSRNGGRCQHCHRTIGRGETICKVDDGHRGGTTRNGNGLGSWVCEGCALAAPVT